jgi:hypothetical protein
VQFTSASSWGGGWRCVRTPSCGNWSPWGGGGRSTCGRSPGRRVANKKPTQKNHLKLFVFWVFKFLMFYEEKKLFSLEQIFYEQVRHKLSFIYKK